MKKARVCAIDKGGALSNLNNYRPISILPLFLKVAEKVINSRFSKYVFDKNSMPYQYGFQKEKSTKSAVSNIKE